MQSGLQLELIFSQRIRPTIIKKGPEQISHSGLQLKMVPIVSVSFGDFTFDVLDLCQLSIKTGNNSSKFIIIR
jgi:hypothetical protein